MNEGAPAPIAVAEVMGSAGLDGAPLELLPLVMGLLGGLALFLFGLDQMTSALKAVAGDRLRTVLARLTVNRLAGVATGAFVTSIIQSSSVTTVLVIGFISSGLMSLSQAVGVIFGANIGTTVTAQIIAFKVTKLSLALLAGGFALTLVSRRESLRHHGAGMLGLGLVFLGMTMMSEAMAPLRDHAPFVAWMVRFENPLVGIAASAAFTGLVQSSSATTGIVIAMASQGLITLPAGIALIFGANVGTCVTALLAAIGKPREALRASLVHLAFNVGGVLLWVGAIDALARFVAGISPQALALEGAARLAAETPRQIANAHTIFNVANTVIFLPFASLLARLVERLVPDQPLPENGAARARFLDATLLSTPAIALDNVRRELVRLGELVQKMLADVLPAMLTGDREGLSAVARRDEDVDRLYDAIIGYMARISEGALAQNETRQLVRLMSIANAIESVGDTIETDLVRRGRGLAAGQVRISPATAKVISGFHAQVSRALAEATEAIAKRDAALAAGVVEMKPLIQRLTEAAANHEAERLVAPEANRLPTYALEKDMIEDLRRVYSYAKRIGRAVIEAEAERAAA
jgi:phosphate:Na+ symporter